MSEDYKNDWVTASLVDDLNYLKTGVEEYEGKKYYYSTGSIKDDSIISEGAYTYNERPSRANRVGQNGDILQARMKNTDKAVFITNELNDQLFSTGFFQIRTDSRTILPKYLFHYFKSIVFLNQKDSNCSGSTQSALNDKSAKNLFVPIAPIPVQRQIVSKIEEFFSDLDKGIVDLKKAQDQLKVYRQAVLKKAFEGELTKEWREQQSDLQIADELLVQIKEERQKHYDQQLGNWKQAVKAWEENGKEGKKPGKPTKLYNEELKIDSNSLLPEVWRLDYLGNLTMKIVDGTHHTPKYMDSGVQFISAKDIKGFNIDFSNTKHISEKEHKELIKRCNPNTGDILLTKSGTIGRVAIVGQFRDYSLFESVALIPKINRIDSKLLMYLVYFITTGAFGNRKQKGVAVKHLHLEDIRKMPIPILSIEEQHQIIQEIESRLSVCDKVEESITESLERAKALRQSILKKAFEGTLLSDEEIAACKAAPDYESASVLLERIKAEKSGKPLKIKKPKKKPPVPQKISTDIQAGVIAKVIQLHEENPKYLHNLTHVKCEKISHLVEYHLQIPLGRVPVKDAAGPDDYSHLKKVEHRAKMAGFFSVVKKEIGHIYSSNRNIQKAIDNLEKKINTSKKEQLEKLIQLFLKFDLESAEIIATIYAGWNNLLINGKTPTDDEIVYESRENWSKRKLGIKRERFYKALEWMRKDEISLIPCGYGLLVTKPKK